MYNILSNLQCIYSYYSQVLIRIGNSMVLSVIWEKKNTQVSLLFFFKDYQNSNSQK